MGLTKVNSHKNHREKQTMQNDCLIVTIIINAVQQVNLGHKNKSIVVVKQLTPSTNPAAGHFVENDHAAELMHVVKLVHKDVLILSMPWVDFVFTMHDACILRNMIAQQTWHV